MIESIGSLPYEATLHSLQSINPGLESTISADVKDEVVFSDLVSATFDNIDKSIQTADNLFTNYILTDDVSTHDLMIAMSKAMEQLQLASEVRNRIVGAYQQITQMPV